MQKKKDVKNDKLKKHTLEPSWFNSCLLGVEVMRKKIRFWSILSARIRGRFSRLVTKVFHTNSASRIPILSLLLILCLLLFSQEGLVYAVEFSHRSGRDLINVAKKRTNIIPIIEDARHPHKYRMLVGMVDTVFADVAQPDQARIVALNSQYFLKNGGHFVISIKVRFETKNGLKTAISMTICSILMFISFPGELHRLDSPARSRVRSGSEKARSRQTEASRTDNARAVRERPRRSGWMLQATSEGCCMRLNTLKPNLVTSLSTSNPYFSILNC